MEQPSSVQWANLYSRAGWRVFPIWAGKKNPIYDGWQTGATADPELIGRYFSDSARNMAVVCGEKFDAWDIEVEHLGAFTAWMERNGYVLPESPIASTGRGGLHILTQPTGVDGTRYLYLDGKHIGELKSKGGYILACPSVTEQAYRWTWFPYRLETSPAPDWLLGLLERPKAGVHKFKSRITSVEDGVRALGVLAASIEGLGEDSHTRNNYLYWAMRRAIEEGVPPRLAAQALRQAAIKSGLDEHEARQTLRSAYDAEAVAQ